ncbi:MAG: hypothetical protein QM784_00720 [Polyangiaceae bacterium]
MNLRRRMKFRMWSMSLGLGLCGVIMGCSLFRSTVNASPQVRWWLFSNFGAREVCPKVLSSGAPLRLDPNGPVIGRFFPNLCEQRVDDGRQTLTLSLAGTGFAWTPIAGRVGFRASATVEYRMDFRMEDDAVYVWGLPTGASPPPQFQLGAVENALVNWAAQGPAGYLATTFGAQILSSRLAEGFTAIRSDSGDEFALGHYVPPQRPPKPYALEGEDRILLTSETTEVRVGQVDVAGPFEVADSDQALYLRMRSEGAMVEALLFPKYVIDPWREGLQTGTPLAPPPTPQLAAFALPLNQEVRQTLPLPKGSYVLVIDHSAKLGQVNPPWNPLGLVGGGSARVSYAVELGETP